ncbi:MULTISPECIES: CBS domain-containing protein [Haloprofundus]|uniref:CBS domain-containing protein n=1 Tax=Haloprofundus TaxID=1911573 RepID=UPI000E42E231|nr:MULTISPECIES: CBS domain-containing protein [Haloprofundus]QCJ45672.1 CBS domain-containing protein [Haloprofundus sp. MHR1]
MSGSVQRGRPGGEPGEPTLGLPVYGVSQRTPLAALADGLDPSGCVVVLDGERPLGVYSPRQVQRDETDPLAPETVGDLTPERPLVVEAGVPAETCLERALGDGERFVLVVDDADRLAGVVTRWQLLAARERGDADTPVVELLVDGE